jgi:hypothetical protein
MTSTSFLIQIPPTRFETGLSGDRISARSYGAIGGFRNQLGKTRGVIHAALTL